MSGILQGSLLQGGRDLCDRSFASSTVLLLPMRGGNGHTGFIDASPVPKTLTVNGNAAMSTTQYKWYGSSGYFDGNGDFLSIPGTLPTALQLGSGDFTIEFYVYTTSTATQFICGNLNDNFGTGHYWVMINSTFSGLHTIQFGIQGTAFRFGNTTLTTNTWQHIAIARYGNSLRCFLNGAQLGTTQTLGNFTGTVTNEFRIASAIPGASNSYFLTGYLQDFRITKGTARYTTNFAPPGAALPDTACECDDNFGLVSLHLPMTGANASTAFTDYSPSTKTVTVNGGAQISTAQSKWNTGSGYFDGTGDYLSVSGSSAFEFGTGDFTIEGWIKSNTTGSMNGPFGQFPAGAVAGKWDIKTRFSGANNFIFTYYSGSAYVDTAASPAVNLNDDAWHHIAVVRSGTNIYMFSDGVLRRSTTISGSQSIGVSSHTFNVGYNPEDNAYYTGYVNDVRITKGLARYTSAFTPPTVALPLSKCRQSDPFHNVVSLLMPMTGVNTATALTDFSPNPKLITAVGNTTRSTTQYKWNGSSLYFDGNGDYLQIPTSNDFAFGTGDFTIELWFYRSGNGQQHLYEGRNGTTTYTILLYLNSSDYLTYYADGAVRISTTSTPALNTWVHIAVCRSGTETKMFMNGIQVGSTYTDLFNYAAPTTYLYIGTNDVATGSFVNGFINDLRITKGVARYTGNFTVPTMPFATVLGPSHNILNQYIASLAPQIWLKFDDAFDSGTSWTTGAWTNSGSASVSAAIVGGTVASVNGLVPGSSYSAVNSGTGTTATFAAQYTPNASTTYYNQTITINMTIRTNSNFRAYSENWLWHQGAASVSNNNGLSINYYPKPDNNDEVYALYLSSGTWRAAYMALPPSPILQNNTVYNITFVYSSTGGTGLGYVKFYINGIPQTTANLSYAVPNTTYAGRFGARALNDSSLEYAARISMDNCLLFNRELSATEIAYLSDYSLKLYS